MKTLSQKGVRGLFDKVIIDGKHDKPIMLFLSSSYLDYFIINLLSRGFGTPYIFHDQKELNRTANCKHYIYRPFINQFSQEGLSACVTLYKNTRKPVFVLMERLITKDCRSFLDIFTKPAEEVDVCTEQYKKEFDCYTFKPTVCEWIEDNSNIPHNTAQEIVINYVKSLPSDKLLSLGYYQLLIEEFNKLFIVSIKKESGSNMEDIMLNYRAALTQECDEDRKKILDVYENFFEHVKTTPIAWMVDPNIPPKDIDKYKVELKGLKVI